ncbi:ABC transporter ATP-binding protein [Lihuaxuella thermophila]|uniref:ABC-2 type transport system ATP-binding protein n=1 Tax=Lihuaxuella thermophila TaxID=1173111 RepID=A0A1H8G750_9BACL|nr:ABC transporter ATP-binding protein [Lihuaxuella thermophila]SEN39846.1 ABC-2 type transport system ATP-binding protein [Lihuaxuella thermophila]
MDVLRISGLVKDYGKQRALNHVDLVIEPGMFGLLGPNGAGKTTLMRILTTLITPTEGTVQYGDLNWKDASSVRKIIGYLPQKFSVYKQIRVDEALKHIAVLKGVEKIENTVQSVLDKVNLTEHARKKIGQLSGGMLRRVGIAQAILGNPKIIVVDEPTAGLDPEERIRFRKLLRSLGKDSIVIISTHIVEDIETTCQKVAILHTGNVIKEGSAEEIARAAEGKVWETTVSQDEFYDLADEWEVLSSYKREDRVEARILSDVPPPDAKPVAATLEDGYLYLMKSREKVT